MIQNVLGTLQVLNKYLLNEEINIVNVFIMRYVRNYSFSWWKDKRSLSGGQLGNMNQ